MKQLIISVIIFFLGTVKCLASHEAGGEITYRHLGGQKYEVKFFVIRDCRGIPLKDPIIRVSGGSLMFGLDPVRSTIRDVSNLCKKLNPCNPPNTTQVGFGFEQHVFTDTVDFAAAPFNEFATNNICEVYFSYEDCCRNGAITTIVPGNFYIESMLNICLAKPNSSPKFYVDPLLFACCNLPFISNFGGYDYTDYDSLSLELTNPLNAHGSHETYNGSYSVQYPMTPYCPSAPGTLNCMPDPLALPPKGIYFNKGNGNFILTATMCNEVAVICVMVNEWRKDAAGIYRKAGAVMRDIQVNVVDCNLNRIPRISSLPDNLEFELDKPNCISFTVCDSLLAGEADSIDISASVLPPSALLTVSDSVPGCKKIELCWTPTEDDCFNASRYGIVLKFSDYYCPYRGITYKAVNIRLKGDCGKLSARKPYDHLVRIYPNPVNDKLQVEIPEVLNGSALEIFDSRGIVLMQSILRGNTTQVDLPGLPAGVYFVKIKAAAGTVVKTFIKY